MTELQKAVEDRTAEAEERRTRRVAAALYEANQIYKIRQRDLVEETGYTRETIRRHIEDEKIRRGLMDPTERYIRAHGWPEPS